MVIPSKNHPHPQKNPVLQSSSKVSVNAVEGRFVVDKDPRSINGSVTGNHAQVRSPWCWNVDPPQL